MLESAYCAERNNVVSSESAEHALANASSEQSNTTTARQRRRFSMSLRQMEDGESSLAAEGPAVDSSAAGHGPVSQELARKLLTAGAACRARAPDVKGGPRLNAEGQPGAAGDQWQNHDAARLPLA